MFFQHKHVSEKLQETDVRAPSNSVVQFLGHGVWAMSTSEFIKNCPCSLDGIAPELSIQLFGRQNEN